MVEEILSSKGRIRILKVLTVRGRLNVSEIARQTGLNYVSTMRHLSVMENHDLVRHKKYGRTRIFHFNDENQEARILKKLIESWEQNK